MHRECREATSALLISAILLCVVLTTLKIPASVALAGASIDIFTQQTPYGGKGSDVPSDAFGAGDVVVLNTLATQSGVPVQNLLVVFTVTPPTNASFSLTAATNSTGIATVNFTLPTPGQGLNESQIFGVWLASASAMIEGTTAEDSVSFEVNWVVQIVSLRTIDGSLSNRTAFGLGGDVGFEIALRNIAYSFKNITLAITVMDALDVPINSSQIDGLVVQPNQTLMFMYAKASIPKTGVFIGNVTAFFSVLTAPANQGGVPYSPQVSVIFNIVPTGNTTIALHDVAALNVIASTASVQVGEILSVDVLVQNEGTETEAFNVNAFLGNILIKSMNVSVLSPYSQVNLQFNLNTSALSPGNYTVSAAIPQLQNEADVADNVFVDGTVEVNPIPPVFVHNVAVIEVATSNNSLHVGDTLQVNVTVLNKGNATESFQVTAFFNSSSIQTLQVDALAPSAQTTLVFAWDTGSVAVGTYRISAFADLPTDIDSSDNTLVDGFVTLIEAPVPVHNVAVVNVTLSTSSVHVGDVLQITVSVLNKGDFAETFNLTAYYNSSAVGTSRVNSLASKARIALVFMWNTSSVTEGIYQIKASASLAEDVDTSDNTFVDGAVSITPRPVPSFVHNVAVIDVKTSNNSLHVGDLLQVNVTVLNKGNATESFQVTAFFNSSAIQTAQINALAPLTQTTLTFIWNTSSVAEGIYQISASASLPSDVDTSDNTFIDGSVTVAKPSPGPGPGPGFSVRDLFLWLLLLLLLLIILTIVLFFLGGRRKRKKEDSSMTQVLPPCFGDFP